MSSAGTALHTLPLSESSLTALLPLSESSPTALLPLSESSPTALLPHNCPLPTPVVWAGGQAESFSTSLSSSSSTALLQWPALRSLPSEDTALPHTPSLSTSIPSISGPLRGGVASITVSVMISSHWSCDYAAGRHNTSTRS